MRCLTLAESLAKVGWEVRFAGGAGTIESSPLLRQSGHMCVEVPPAQTDDTVWLNQRCGGTIDLLIVDHYQLDAVFETGCRAWTERIMVIDDLADRPHDCDILLDQTFGRQMEDYAALVPPHCKRLIGTDYALVRPQFAAVRDDAIRRRAARTEVERIFVSMGTTDPVNATALVLAALEGLDRKMIIDVVIGGTAAALPEITMRSRSLGVELHVDRADVWNVMAEADMAIGAGGTSSWERCVLGLPTLLIVIAENQRDLAASLQQAGAAESIRYSENLSVRGLTEVIARLCNDSAKRQAMAEAAAAIVDGRGVTRVTQVLLS